MSKVSPEALNEVLEAFQRYEELVWGLPLALSTRNKYVSHARRFVRWLAGEIEFVETREP